MPKLNFKVVDSKAPKYNAQLLNRSSNGSMAMPSTYAAIQRSGSKDRGTVPKMLKGK